MRPWTKAELLRLLSKKVSYMEIAQLAGGFSCGTCVFLSPDGHCQNRSVQAPVSPNHGCCNLFEPADGGKIFPVSCRCGKPSTKKCHLCKAELCEFHSGAQQVTTTLATGLQRTRLEPICFPDCTSDFGTLQERGVLVGRA